MPPAMSAATAQLHEGVRTRSATNALERHDTHTHTHTHTPNGSPLRAFEARRFEPSSGSPRMPLSGSPLMPLSGSPLRAFERLAASRLQAARRFEPSSGSPL